jgi:hypothetical protein
MQNHCSYCHGKFGLVRHRRASKSFCSQRCVDQHKARMRAERSKCRSLVDWLIGVNIRRRVPAECVRACWPERTRAGTQGQQTQAVVAVAPGSRIFARACKPALARPGHANFLKFAPMVDWLWAASVNVTPYAEAHTSA